MKTQPTQTYNPSFGIYTHSRKTYYGQCIYGKYKGYNIEIYDDKKDKAKLYYVSDHIRRWVKSKLIYFMDNKKHVTRSENKLNYKI